jgi:hypothetical protein
VQVVSLGGYNIGDPVFAEWYNRNVNHRGVMYLGSAVKVRGQRGDGGKTPALSPFLNGIANMIQPCLHPESVLSNGRQ